MARLNYSKANELLTGRCRDSRKMANNTYLHRGDDGRIMLRYHDTDVVTLCPNGDIILDSGGWRTKMTKERMNLVVNLQQDKGVWYVSGARFADGMIIHPDGNTTGASHTMPRYDREIKRKVRAYARLCADSIPIELPGAGDCWYCHLTTEDGESLGDMSRDTGHLFSHIKEGYVVPSLVLNALKEHGYSPLNNSIIYASIFQCEHNYDFDLGKRITERAVYRYIMRRFGYAV